jgi:Concanavalin A-like lectin/glucanases superfamily
VAVPATLALSILPVMAPALASGFSAAAGSGSSSFSSGTLQLEASTPGGNCYSTGTGSGGSTTSNSASCTAGSPAPSGQLSTSSSSSTTTITSNGTNSPGAGHLGSTSCGVAKLTDSASATDWSGAGPDTALVYDGVTYGTTGPYGGTNTAVTFDGTTGWVETTTEYSNPESFTIAAWIKTTSGGGVIGFDSSQNPVTTSPSSYDRMLWVDPTGHLVWAVYDGSVAAEITSSAAVNTGNWVFVAVSVGTNASNPGMDMYVNGTNSASNTAYTAASSYSGWWQLGYTTENGGGWSDAGSAHFGGSIAEVAVIPTQLSSAQIAGLYADSLSQYQTAVATTYSAANYWQMNDSGSLSYQGSLPGGTASTTFEDASGNANKGTAVGGVTYGSSGPPALSAKGITLNGSSGYVETTTSYSDPNDLSIVAWFESTSSSGGNIVAFTNARGTTGQSSENRLLWMDNAGKVVWGAGSTPTELSSTAAYDNGQWHMVVAEVGPAGMQLWVDGVEVASSSVSSVQSFTGWWHIGWGNESSGWSDAPGEAFFPGSLSEVAIVPSQLTGAQIAELYSAGSVAGFGLDAGALTPTAYWPLQDSGSTNTCGTTEITVQETSGASTYCLYPVAAGACPAPNSTYTATGLGVQTFTAVPAHGASVTVTVTMKLSAAEPSALAGLHQLLDLTFGTLLSATLWTAQVAYPGATTEL